MGAIDHGAAGTLVMTRFAEIQTHVASMSELLDIVGAMRSLAGMRVQEAQRVLPGIRGYANTMAAAIGTALPLLPEARPKGKRAAGRRAFVLCAAEHGFVGGFNERLLEAANNGREPDDELFLLGTRGAMLAAERGHHPAWTRPMATRLATVPETISVLSGALYDRLARGRISRVEVMFARYRQGGEAAIEQRLLLPFDTATLPRNRTAQAPLHNLPPGILLERLIAEYVFAVLTEAAVESITSESAARFAAMQSAHDNVSKKLEGLRQSARQARQDDITTEMLDLVTGSGALSGNGRAS